MGKLWIFKGGGHIEKTGGIHIQLVSDQQGYRNVQQTICITGYMLFDPSITFIGVSYVKIHEN